MKTLLDVLVENHEMYCLSFRCVLVNKSFIFSGSRPSSCIVKVHMLDLTLNPSKPRIQHHTSFAELQSYPAIISILSQSQCFTLPKNTVVNGLQ